MVKVIVILIVCSLEIWGKEIFNLDKIFSLRSFNWVDTAVSFLQDKLKKYPNSAYLTIAATLSAIAGLSWLGSAMFGMLFMGLALFYSFSVVEGETLAIKYHESFYAPLCWFIVLGPFGALTYKIIARLGSYENGVGNVATKLHALAAWAPARLSSFIFALVGDFSKVLGVWLANALNIKMPSSEVLQSCVVAGGADTPEILLNRAFISLALLASIFVLML